MKSVSVIALLFTSTFCFSQEQPNKIVRDAMVEASSAYISAYTDAAKEIGTMMSKFALVKSKAITSSEALDYYNLMLSKIFGKVNTLAQAERLIRDKGFEYMEAKGLYGIGQELKAKAHEMMDK